MRTAEKYSIWILNFKLERNTVFTRFSHYIGSQNRRTNLASVYQNWVNFCLLSSVIKSNNSSPEILEASGSRSHRHCQRKVLDKLRTQQRLSLSLSHAESLLLEGSRKLIFIRLSRQISGYNCFLPRPFLLISRSYWRLMYEVWQ